MTTAEASAPVVPAPRLRDDASVRRVYLAGLNQQHPAGVQDVRLATVANRSLAGGHEPKDVPIVEPVARATAVDQIAAV